MWGAALLRKTFRYATATVQLFYTDKWYATRKKGFCGTLLQHVNSGLNLIKFKSIIKLIILN